MITLAKPCLGEEESQAVLEVLQSGQVASGPRVKAFEAAFATYVGASFGIATSNGTTALSVALQAAGVQPGDKVITTAFSFIATANAIRHIGAIPVFADIHPKTYNITADSIREVLDEHIDAKAVLIVHLYGQPCDMEPIMRLVSDRHLILVEDCAQAHGAEYQGKRVGTFGRTAAFSFYATKNMTTGEGGMVTTSLPEVAEKARKLVNHGRIGQYLHDEVGYNHRLTDLAAAIGLVQLGRLPELNHRRRENAAYLTSKLAALSEVAIPDIAAGCLHVYHQYTVSTQGRDELLTWLTSNGVSAGIIYPVPLHLQPVYSQPGRSRLENAEHAAEAVISLPVHPGLSPDDLEHVANAVIAFYRGGGGRA